jgi:hypothetical protein
MCHYGVSIADAIPKLFINASGPIIVLISSLSQVRTQNVTLNRGPVHVTLQSRRSWLSGPTNLRVLRSDQ